MPPSIAYWTSAFEPEMEAIAAEVALLRRRFPASAAWGISHRHWAMLSLKRGVCLHPRLHLLFRAITRLLEPAFQLNHIMGSLGDWFYLRGARQRPTVLTVAALSPPVEEALLRRVDRFVVEHPGGEEALVRAGIDHQNIRLIFPPVDLVRFLPSLAPAGPFTVLFASSPDKKSWLEARGLPQLLDAAALRPRMRFRLLWRPWGDAESSVRRWIAQRGLDNIDLVVGVNRDMAAQYRQAHVTIAPFLDPQRCKPAPNSLIESLACGRPVLLTEAVGLASVIHEGGGGWIASPSAEALAEGLDRLQAEWDTYSRAARALAERWFNADSFLEAYAQLYEEVLASRAGPRACSLFPRFFPS